MGRDMRHEVIVGVERRRRWREEEKLSILEKVGSNGATVSDVARCHDFTRQHIYQWRQELRRKGVFAADFGDGLSAAAFAFWVRAIKRSTALGDRSRAWKLAQAALRQ